MSDKLEQHIKEHRQVFSAIEKAEREVIWEQVATALPAELKRGWQIRWGRLAAACTLLLFGLFAGWHLAQPSSEKASLVAFDLELTAHQYALKKQVEERSQQINLHEIDPTAYAQILTELRLLDSLNREARTDVNAFGDQRVSLRILTRYYERKLQILELLSKEIENKNRHEKKQRIIQQ